MGSGLRQDLRLRPSPGPPAFFVRLCPSSSGKASRFQRYLKELFRSGLRLDSESDGDDGDSGHGARHVPRQPVDSDLIMVMMRLHWQSESDSDTRHGGDSVWTPSDPNLNERRRPYQAC